MLVRSLLEPVSCFSHGIYIDTAAMCVQDESMEKARLMLGKARRRLNLVYKQSRSNLMLYVVLFATGVFIVVYVLKKLYRLGRWIV